MSNPLQKIVEKYVDSHASSRIRRVIFGIAQDFWKDGEEDLFAVLVDFAKKGRVRSNDTSSAFSDSSNTIKKATTSTKPLSSAAQHREVVPEVWHAEPGEVSEKMWGVGYVTPGDEEVSKMLINPLGLNKDLSVLDLSAGLGGRLRWAADEFKAYITGLEPDPMIAARGMELSIKMGRGKRAAIASYDPMNFSVDRRYDCIVARETFYRVADRRKFFKDLSACAKPGAQISFTDYIINPEDREKPAILAWKEFELGSNPASLIEMAEDWAKAGFNLRVHDDQTAFYVKEVMIGIKRLAVFLGQGSRPDAETKAALRRRMETWIKRLAAIEQGMKFYRFYGTKH